LNKEKKKQRGEKQKSPAHPNGVMRHALTNRTGRIILACPVSSRSIISPPIRRPRSSCSRKSWPITKHRWLWLGIGPKVGRARRNWRARWLILSTRSRAISGMSMTIPCRFGTRWRRSPPQFTEPVRSPRTLTQLSQLRHVETENPLFFNGPSQKVCTTFARLFLQRCVGVVVAVVSSRAEPRVVVGLVRVRYIG
jgi:hypothetical protein